MTTPIPPTGGPIFPRPEPPIPETLPDGDEAAPADLDFDAPGSERPRPVETGMFVRVYCAGHTWTAGSRILTPELLPSDPAFRIVSEPRMCPKCGAPLMSYGGPVAGPAGVVTEGPGIGDGGGLPVAVAGDAPGVRDQIQPPFPVVDPILPPSALLIDLGTDEERAERARHPWQIGAARPVLHVPGETEVDAPPRRDWTKRAVRGVPGWLTCDEVACPVCALEKAGHPLTAEQWKGIAGRLHEEIGIAQGLGPAGHDRIDWLTGAWMIARAQARGVPVPETSPPTRVAAEACVEHAETERVAAGWGCCRCRTYNGLQRVMCKHCGHARCSAPGPLGPDAETPRPTSPAVERVDDPQPEPISPRFFQDLARHVLRVRSEPPPPYFPTVGSPTAPVWTIHTAPKDDDGMILCRCVELPEVSAKHCDGDRAQRECMALVLEWWAEEHLRMQIRGGPPDGAPEQAPVWRAAVAVAVPRFDLAISTRKAAAVPAEVLAMFRRAPS